MSVSISAKTTSGEVLMSQILHLLSDDVGVFFEKTTKNMDPPPQAADARGSSHLTTCFQSNEKS